MKKINLTIDGSKISVDEGTAVLEAAKQAKVRIPTLCHYEGLENYGACRLCVVEIEGRRNLPASCVTPVQEGMVVRTNTARLREARKELLKLILASHPADCKTCEKHGRCELQNLSYEFGIRDFGCRMHDKRHFIDETSPSIKRDLDKCILCGRCVRVCRDVQSVSVYDFANRGCASIVTPALCKNMSETNCVACGQCTIVCPTGALSETDSVEEVWALLKSGKRAVVQVAPAIRVSIGELFGCAPGTLVKGKLVTALKRLGFNEVFDTNFGADLTIMEEASELVEAVKEGKTHLASSCCPAWINFVEEFYPDLLPHLSTCKSPHQMVGALVKTYYAEKLGKKREDIAVVSIMPCTAKKYEIKRKELKGDVDAVLTTRELARMIKEVGLELNDLPESEFDAPFGITTGAGAIFGASGGVTEAALRTAAELITGKPHERIEFKEVRGFGNVRETELVIGGKKLKIAVAQTLGGARKLLEEIRSGRKTYNFVEVMACPGGCIGGGGQPIPVRESRQKVIEARAKAIYDLDASLPLRRSIDNPAIKQLYKEFLGKPSSKKSKEILHTSYKARKAYGV
ncbi:(2Fe-2S)-binding protein [Candidatus Micrarchaeota archaeon]|nr:(2Fe-2S)-binding protein [Candidatus Micrarchaeota archaeon]